MNEPNEHKEQHEHGAEALSIKLEGSAKLRSWIMRAVVGFLILVFIGGMVWGANDLLGREGQDPPPPELDATITDPPEGAAEILAYVQDAAAMALAGRPKLGTETKFDFGGDYLNSIAFTGEGADFPKAKRLTATLKLVAPDLVNRLHKALPADETQYGDDFGELLWALGVTPDALEEAACDFFDYRCASCGNVASEIPEECPKCEAPDYQIRYKDNYTFTLTFADGSPAIAALFHPRSPEDIQALLGGELQGYAEILGIAPEYKNARVVAAVQRASGKLLSLQFKKDIALEMDLRVDPALEDINTRLSCTLGESTNFSFTWPAVVLSAKETTMNKRASSQLTARVDAPKGQETPLVWQSSDPAVCAVDGDGYLKAGRDFGEAVISASFELDGVTYTGECAVHVKVPVEKNSLNREKLRLAPGETKQLKAKVSPNNAAYKDVVWYTEDGAVAAVDADGVVTAVAPGKTVVYALTVDGYYRSSCAVTVKGGG